MSRDAGGLRDAAGLDRCLHILAELAAREGGPRARVSSARRGGFKGGRPPLLGIEPGLEAWEATNLMTVATAVAASARWREESRGAHWRDDFADSDRNDSSSAPTATSAAPIRSFVRPRTALRVRRLRRPGPRGVTLRTDPRTAG